MGFFVVLLALIFTLLGGLMLLAFIGMHCFRNTMATLYGIYWKNSFDSDSRAVGNYIYCRNMCWKDYRNYLESEGNQQN